MSWDDLRAFHEELAALPTAEPREADWPEDFDAALEALSKAALTPMPKADEQ